MSEDNNKKSFSRLYNRLNVSKDKNEFYESHQLYRILYNRLSSNDETETEILLHDGANYLLKNNQFESGTDLLVLLIKYCIEKKKVADSDTVVRMKNYFSLMKPQSEERRTLCIWAERWIIGDAELLWHDWLAVLLWGEGQLESARYHFMLSGQGVHTALFLVHLQRKKGYHSEVDLFLVQAVLQFLCLQRTAAASSTFSVYIRCHPELHSGPPFAQMPLLNFIWFLLLAVEARLSSAAFTDLCEHYAKHLNRDPLYAEYLARIGQLYFGIASPGKKDSFLSNIMSMLVGGPSPDEDGSIVVGSNFSTEEMD